jgi:undecaprenyl diphosphate synthase
VPQIGEHRVEREDEGVRAALARLRERCPEADPLAYLPDVHPSRIPRHIAIIMDGNGRWAQARGFPREFGHRNGAIVVREIVEHCGRLGVEVLTLYSFSLENWKRPETEVRALMQLCLTYLDGEERELVRNGVRLRVIGRRQGLPDEVVRAIERVERATEQGRRATLCLAINYGGRAEIVDAARRLAEEVRAGLRSPDSIDEQALAAHLGTAGLPDPDLLIRTGGEARVSNFLLWQISYSEFVVTDTLWPDFRPAHIDAAIREFARRRRRFGGLDELTPA